MDTKEAFEFDGIFERAMTAVTSDAFFVSELIGNQIVINERKLNRLTPKLLEELFLVNGKRIDVSDEICIRFIIHLIEKAHSLQKIYHDLNFQRLRRHGQLSLKEKIVGIDFDIGGPGKRSPYLNRALQLIGYQDAKNSYKEKYFSIIYPVATNA